MTTSQKFTHHNAAAAPEQKGSHRAPRSGKTPPPGVSVSPTGAGEIPTERETLTPIQPRAPQVRMLRMTEVKARTGMSRTTIWRRIRAGTFPAPVQLGPNSIGWPEPAIVEWVNGRPVVAYAIKESGA